MNSVTLSNQRTQALLLYTYEPWDIKTNLIKPSSCVKCASKLRLQVSEHAQRNLNFKQEDHYCKNARGPTPISGLALQSMAAQQKQPRELSVPAGPVSERNLRQSSACATQGSYYTMLVRRQSPGLAKGKEGLVRA